MKNLYTILSSNEHICSILFQYLDHPDQLSIKLSNKSFLQLLERTVPIHNFISILHSIHAQQQPIPLHIPTEFILHPTIIKRIISFFEQTTGKALPNLITKFILLHHFHYICMQLISEFEYNEAFLLLIAPKFSSSLVFQHIVQRHNLLSIVKSSITKQEDELVFITVTQEWLKHSWVYFSSPRQPYPLSLPFRYYLIDVPQNMPDQVFHNRSLTYFLLLHWSSVVSYVYSANMFSSTFVRQLMSHTCWENSYSRDVEFQSLLLFLTRHVSDAVSHIPLQECSTEEHAIQLVAFNGSVLQYLPLKWKTNKKVVLAALYQNVDAASFMNESMYQDKDVILHLARQQYFKSPIQMPQVIQTFSDDVEFLKQLFRVCSWKYRTYFPEFIQNDKALITKSLERRGTNFAYLKDTSWLVDREVILAALKSAPTIVFANAKCLDRFTTDKEMLLEGLHHPRTEQRHLLQTNRQFVLQAVRKSPYCFKFLSYGFQNDFAVVLEMLQSKKSIVSLEHIPVRFTTEKEYVKQILQINGSCFRLLNSSLRQDQELLCIAIQQNGMVFDRYATTEQQKLLAVQKAVLQFYGLNIHL